MKFKLVRRHEDADANAILVTLYKCPEDMIRGWYVGPMQRLKDGGQVPYAPRSQRLLGMVAILRACQIAESLGLECYIIDPDALWDRLK